jgi:preprotein translocase subunit SecG
MFLFITNLFVGVVLFSLGFLLTEKNAPFALSGYNQMSKDEQKLFNLPVFIQFFRKFHFYLGASFIILSLLFYLLLNEDALGYLLAFYPIIAYIFFIYKTKSFYPIKEKKILKIVTWILIISAIFIIVLLSFGNSSSEIIIKEKQIEISGMYGQEIAFTEISSITLVNHLPKITLKTNGFALSTVKKGYFKTSNGEKVKLILNTLESPYIFIELQNGKKIYYSKSSENNKQLYEELKKIRAK